MKCNYCGKKSYNEYCVAHKPRKPIKAGTHTIKDRQENKKFRESKLNFQGYLICELCGSWNGSDADHIKKKSSNPHLRYDESNKRILCRSCHIRVT
jgi:5-methylcytosine-specific restriction endonuclease McrA